MMKILRMTYSQVSHLHKSQIFYPQQVLKTACSDLTYFGLCIYDVSTELYLVAVERSSPQARIKGRPGQLRVGGVPSALPYKRVHNIIMYNFPSLKILCVLYM